MQIKLKHSLNTYSYLVMFDLATRVSGVCVWDLNTNTPILTKAIRTSDTAELPALDLYDALDSFFIELVQSGITLDTILVYQEAMPAQLHGGGSTVQTFISLARSHAVLDLYTAQHNIAIYDYTGIYPVSTHAYLRRVKGVDAQFKIDKNFIKIYIEGKYGLESLTYDEADAVLLAETFVNIKWNKDLDVAIKDIKKHIKTLKDAHRITALQQEIERLSALRLQIC